MTIREPDSDYFHIIADSCSPDDSELIARVREFVDTQLLPVINEFWERAEFPVQLLPSFRALGVVGTTVQGYGCPGLTKMQSGLVAMELSRGDGSFNTFNNVQSGVVIATLASLGDEDQKQRWIPPLATLDQLGAFALTEPEHGSDSVGLETSARRDGDSWVLNGSKRWIGNGHLADTVIVWARDTADEEVKAFVVERQPDGSYPAGYIAENIPRKIGKRAIGQAHIDIQEVRVPLENRLASSTSFRDVSTLLRQSRSNVAWESVGHAMAAFEIAARYAQTRVQFGKPIGSFQLVQATLADMLAELTAIQAMTVRVAMLLEQDRLRIAQASLAKLHVARCAREICRSARDLLAANGLLLDYHVARHLTDMEVAVTYEGTESMQRLIVGREITGISAFA